MNKAIEINNLTKKYNEAFTLGEINLTIPSGQIIGLIGENGAGKTTLIKCLLNIIKKDTGSIKIFDKDTGKYENFVKEDIGVVLDDMFLPEVLTVTDVDMIMKDVYKSWDSNLFYEYMRNFGIDKSKKINKLSKGMRKKLEIATSLAHHPKLLILDEPTSGLDPVVRSEVLDIFLKFLSDEEHTILLSTHITSDLEHIADKIVFIDKGKIILDETRDNLMDNYAILKCELEYFKKIDEKDIISYKKNKYDYTILVSDSKKAKKKYKECIFDKLTIDDLMVLMIKGEK